MSNHLEYPKEAGIYKLTCQPNGKIYIGKSINLNRRLKEYERGYKQTISRYLKNAILKYGWDSFKIEILETVIDFNKERDNFSLLQRESYYIELLDTTDVDKGYNICKFSSDRTGVKASDETREKMRNSRLGKKRKPFSEKARENMRQGQLGKKMSDEQKEKISQSNLGRTFSEETKAKISMANLGMKRSDETKEKMSQSKLGKPSLRKGKKVSDETKEKIRKSSFGRKHSEETKEKMRQSHLKRNNK